MKLVEELELIPDFPMVICHDGLLINQSKISHSSHGIGLTHLWSKEIGARRIK